MSFKKEGLERFYIIFIILAFLFISYELHRIEVKLSKSIINIVYNQTQATVSNIALKVNNKSYKELDNYLPLLLSKDIQRVFVLVYKNGILYSVEDLPKHGISYPRGFYAHYR